MIDELSRNLYEVAEKQALHDGTPLIDMLDRVGVLVTIERQKKYTAAVIERLLLELESFQPVTIASLGGNQTVTGAYEGCLAYIRIYLETLEKS